MNKQTNILRLKELLNSENPVHDTPIGVIHPYWARKPMNIIETIIEALTNEEELVIDPFMGSGTTVFAALRKNRKVIGTDINPLSSFIVKELIQLSNDGTEEVLEQFVAEAEEALLPLFRVSGNRYVERERFAVSGVYENGKFSLKLEETVTKELRKGSWKDRQVEVNPSEITIPSQWKQYLESPFNFSEAELLPNSRIAIPKGARLADYYTSVNKVCVNYLLNLLEENGYSENEKNACKLLISSSLPLLRLSDKKASSQWPYWRPKNNLTSRNPIIVLHDRLKRIKKGIQWLKQSGVTCMVGNINDSEHNDSFTVKVGQVAIQELKSLIQTKPKLVLTDPPYTDHVPYLEYSAYWNSILGFKLEDKDYEMEIVNSDAPARKKDSADYTNRLADALKVCADIVDETGLVVWFYQDQDLRNWQKLYDAAQSCKMDIVDIIHMNKQRRSMKTVTTPGRTLDGDLIVVFAKNESKLNLIGDIEPENNTRDDRQEYYSQYVSIIKSAMLEGTINDISNKHNTISELINQEK